MSEYIRDNIFDYLDNPKEFKARSKLFKIPELSAWEVQTIFFDILDFYDNMFDKYKSNNKLGIQYDTGFNKRTRQCYIKKKHTNLSKFVKYCTFIKSDKLIEVLMKSKKLNVQYEKYKTLYTWDRIVKLIDMARNNLVNKLPVITFTTGTHRKSPYENGKTISSYIFKDSTNTRHKTWFAYKLPKAYAKSLGLPIDYLYLPIQANRKYHKHKMRRSEFTIKVDNNNKVNVITTRIADPLMFKDFNKVVGMDLNVKHNFCVFDGNTVIDYDRKHINEVVKSLDKLDKIGLKNITTKQKGQLEKTIRRNEWYFKKLISEILDVMERDGITDVVMEDLLLSDATFIRNTEFKIKYSKLVRLLRLGSIKKWMNEQAEKRGIRVHITPAHYTSQQCSKCKISITRDNRLTQENFSCVSCGHQNNADMESSINIKYRYTSDVLKLGLHDNDEFGRLRPKKHLNKDVIKNMLLLAS